MFMLVGGGGLDSNKKFQIFILNVDNIIQYN